MPPLGALHLGAAARRRGHEVRFLDLALMLRRGELPDDDSLIASCAQVLVDAGPEVLGLGAMISSMPATLHLAAEVRRLAPELPIVLGGQGPETVELAVLGRHPAIDLVAVGEADETFADVLDVLSDEHARRQLVGAGEPGSTTHTPSPGGGLQDIPGLALRQGGVPTLTAPRPVIADLDGVDLPAFDLAESPAAYAAAAGGGEALFPIDLGRGCSFSCSFCTTSVFWGRQVRYLSPRRAADAFDLMASLEGMADGGCVYVTHDLFTADRQRVLDICAEKVRRGNRLPWECRTRIDLVDEELLTAMKDAGCRRILYGVESDSAQVLKAVDKGGRQAGGSFDVRAVLTQASKVGMASILGVMAGVPGESADDVEASLQLMADGAVIDGCSLSMHWFNVTPGNGQSDVASAAHDFRLIPGLHADLVRGHDIPAGQVHGVQAGLIASDPEIFAGFRIFAPDWTTPRTLYLLTRNAHLLLEVLPRSLKACAKASGATLLQTLTELLTALADGAHCKVGDDAGATNTTNTNDEAGDADRHEQRSKSNQPWWPGPRAAAALAAQRNEHGDPWDELLVLHRGAAVRLVSALIAQLAAETNDERLLCLLSYERALFETTETSLRRFARDPLPLVRDMDCGRWSDESPASDLHGQRAVLFSRQGEVVRAHALSDFLADAHDLTDDQALRSRWPGASDTDVASAREMLATLTPPSPPRHLP